MKETRVRTGLLALLACGFLLVPACSWDPGPLSIPDPPEDEQPPPDDQDEGDDENDGGGGGDFGLGGLTIHFA